MRASGELTYRGEITAEVITVVFIHVGGLGLGAIHQLAMCHTIHSTRSAPTTSPIVRHCRTPCPFSPNARPMFLLVCASWFPNELNESFCANTVSTRAEIMDKCPRCRQVSG